MFYDIQPEMNKMSYRQIMRVVGSLTRLFSENDCPYLPYRAHENIFCKYFQAENLARFDCSADAKKDFIGIGLKTWTGSDDQKIAEFGKLRETFKDLNGLELVKKISEYRNERIRITKNIHGINEMVYHIIKRVPNAMQIIECAFDLIDIDNIVIDNKRGLVNNTYFNDGKHTYHFSISKNTLYMIFENYEILDEFDIEVYDDPFNVLMSLSNLSDDINTDLIKNIDIEPLDVNIEKLPDYAYLNLDEKVSDDISKDFSKKLCLRLYSTKRNGRKFVPMRSGLNQWNGSRLNTKTKKKTPRDPNELYIPYPKKDREVSNDFFPPRGTIFDLQMPDGSNIKAKVCQADGKAIMSNPNSALGKWLLRNVFELDEGTPVTYEMLEKFGIDSVIFEKISENCYRIDFSEIGTYEEYVNYLES